MRIANIPHSRIVANVVPAELSLVGQIESVGIADQADIKNSDFTSLYFQQSISRYAGGIFCNESIAVRGNVCFCVKLFNLISYDSIFPFNLIEGLPNKYLISPPVFRTVRNQTRRNTVLVGRRLTYIPYGDVRADIFIGLNFVTQKAGRFRNHIWSLINFERPLLVSQRVGRSFGGTLGGIGRPYGGGGLSNHLVHRTVELALASSGVILCQGNRPFCLVGTYDRLVRAYSCSPSLISTDTHAQYSEKYECNLSFIDTPLNRRLILSILPLLFLFSVAGGILTLRWPWQDGNPSFIVRWGLFAIFVLVGQECL